MNEEFYIGSSIRTTREDLLKHYAEVPMRGVLQLDVCCYDSGVADIFGRPAYELPMKGALNYALSITGNNDPREFEAHTPWDVPIRVTLSEGVSQEEAIYYLHEMIRTLEEGWEHNGTSAFFYIPGISPPSTSASPNVEKS